MPLQGGLQWGLRRGTATRQERRRQPTTAQQTRYDATLHCSSRSRRVGMPEFPTLWAPKPLGFFRAHVDDPGGSGGTSSSSTARKPTASAQPREAPPQCCSLNLWDCCTHRVIWSEQFLVSFTAERGAAAVGAVGAAVYRHAELQLPTEWGSRQPNTGADGMSRVTLGRGM